MSEFPSPLPDLAIRNLRADDHPALLALWRTDPGIVLRPEDGSPRAFAAFLARNPGLCLGACPVGRLVGATMAGWDGRRAHVYHFAVTPGLRRRGIGRALAVALVARLRAAGILRAHLLVVRDNVAAHAFWSAMGWQLRDDLELYTAAIAPGDA